MTLVLRLPDTPQPIDHPMVQHESRVLWRGEEVLEGRSEAEVAAAVHAQYPIWLCGPVVHDGLEIGHVRCGQESVDDGLVVVVTADEVVQTPVEATGIVVKARFGELVE